MGSNVKSKSISIGRYFLASFRMMLCCVSVWAFATPRAGSYPEKVKDTAIGREIIQQIAAHQKALYYPGSVSRMYRQGGYKLIWIAPETVKTPAVDAMLMLDCVLQFGLRYDDYHPEELSYNQFYKLRKEFATTGDRQKAEFDILLTDAMINLINNLHYGKLNPLFTASKIDSGNAPGFAAVKLLADAIASNDFKGLIETAQPQTKTYLDLQHQLLQLTGSYRENCYKIPQIDILNIAVNMERLRWITPDTGNYVRVNIPSFTLEVHNAAAVKTFNVIVGKQPTPTPTLQSRIEYFITCPEWKVPSRTFIEEILPKSIADTGYLEKNKYTIYDARGNYVAPEPGKFKEMLNQPGQFYARQSIGCANALGLFVFRFPNDYEIYLHDTPFQQLFAIGNRALSDGCIRIEHADKFAATILELGHSADKINSMQKAITIYKKRRFDLHRALPLTITYLTCEVDNGKLVTYNDVYNLDLSLKMALFNYD